MLAITIQVENRWIDTYPLVTVPKIGEKLEVERVTYTVKDVIHKLYNKEGTTQHSILIKVE